MGKTDEDTRGVIKPVRLVEWEDIAGECRRARVLGGWLVRVVSDPGGITFVPDPDHTWGTEEDKADEQG